MTWILAIVLVWVASALWLLWEGSRAPLIDDDHPDAFRSGSQTHGPRESGPIKNASTCASPPREQSPSAPRPGTASPK